MQHYQAGTDVWPQLAVRLRTLLAARDLGDPMIVAAELDLLARDARTWAGQVRAHTTAAREPNGRGFDVPEHAAKGGASL
jgi:hypothetical protein